jgi:hypothetical protein
MALMLCIGVDEEFAVVTTVELRRITWQGVFFTAGMAIDAQGNLFAADPIVYKVIHKATISAGMALQA